MTYTHLGSAEAESRVAEDLSVIVEAVRTHPEASALEAMFLLGGFARGEGAVIHDAGGTLRGFNDYDLLLVFPTRPRKQESYAALSRELAGRLCIDFVDLGVAGVDDLAAAPPTLFWYELGVAHRVLWSRGDPPAIRRFPLEELDPLEGPRLLVNRGMALLWAALRLWPDTGSPSQADVHFSTIAAHKAVLAAGDAALLREGTYSVKARERLESVLAREGTWSWTGAGFGEAYRRGTEFREKPAFGSCDEALSLWHEARGHHEAGFAAAESARTGSPAGSWELRSKKVGDPRDSTLSAPRVLARAVRRRLRGEPARDADTRCFAEFPSLLYAPAAGSRGEEVGNQTGVSRADRSSWRKHALELVRLWHP